MSLSPDMFRDSSGREPGRCTRRYLAYHPGRRTSAHPDVAELAPTVALTGTSIEPVLVATAAAQRAGTAGGDHIAVIRRFWDRVPRAVDAPRPG